MRRPQARTLSRLAQLIIALLLLISPARVFALSQSDFDAIYGDYPYYQDTVDCSAKGGASQVTGGLSNGSNVYILGDSITARASSAYTAGFQQKGVTATIDGSSGRSIAGGGLDGNKLSGLDAAKQDAPAIKNADAIIVALGTNGGNTTQSVDQLIAAIKTSITKSSVSLYWVDTIGVGGANFNAAANKQANTAIYGEASGQGYKVISWFKAVDPDGDPQNPSTPEKDPNQFIDNSDQLGVHPTQAGISGLVSTVVSNTTANNSTAQSSTSAATCCGTSSSTVANGTPSENQKTAFNYFTSAPRSLAGFMAAGIVGNLINESGVDPQKVQGGGQSTTPPGSTSVGWGIAQWTPASTLVDYAKSVNRSPTDLGTQLDLIWSELNGGSESAAGNKLKAATNVADATRAFASFERFQNWDNSAGAGEMQSRIDAATGVYQSLGGTTSTPAASNPVVTPGSQQPVIVLDPGHGDGGGPSSHFDPVTGVTDGDYFNDPEAYEVWDVAQTVKTKLTQDGYKVVLTKTDVHQGVSGSVRAQIANSANAALAVSIHDDHSVPWDSFAQLYYQKMGLYRTADVNGTHKTTTFNNQALADKAAQIAKTFIQERSAAEGRPVVDKNVDFTNRAGLDPGNIPLVDLLSNVPWMYNEVGAAPSGARLSADQLNKYAQGLINSIEKSVPSTGAASPSCGGSGGVVAGSIVQTALGLAWDYKSSGRSKQDAKPSYQTAKDQFNPVGDWTDCGVFVATVMHASGVDTNYPPSGSWTSQAPYVQAHPEKYTVFTNVSSTASLQPGDILINTHHTMIYVGPQHGSKGDYTAVDASLGDRVPGTDGPEWMIAEGGLMVARVK